LKSFGVNELHVRELLKSGFDSVREASKVLGRVTNSLDFIEEGDF
jgi:hypothetical protein